jgi:hypothetical protein
MANKPKKAIAAVLWVGLAIFNFGAINAQARWENMRTHSSLNFSQRDELGFIVAMSCVIPPIELVTSLTMTNFLQHGWTLGSWEAPSPSSTGSKNEE